MTGQQPEVSVLMGVYNAAPTLERTLDSILDQDGVSLEFIVVDDGSTDGSGGILDRRAASDPRLRVLHQANAGLTAALRRGSELARGRYIARQDAGGDRSLPGRLAAQAQALRSAPDAAFVTCGHRYLDADDVFLCEEVRGQADVDAGLGTLRFPGVRGIMHASVMVDAARFRAAGGYREAFQVAQDIDLWLRLLETGACVVVDRALYDCRFEANGISARRHAQQMAYAELAVRCAIARRSGQPEPALEPRQDILDAYATGGRARESDYDYFVASCLRGRDPARARRHYLRAWRGRPGNWKALLRAALTW